MAQHSTIEWTDATWNPVTGCNKISLGCKNCYAETFAERFRGVKGHPYEQGFDLRLWPDRLKTPLSWKKPKQIFVNSMSDLFQVGVPFEFVDGVFETMRIAKWHKFQLLTKRPERLLEYMKERVPDWKNMGEKYPHIWLGTSVETQDYIERASLLAKLGSAVRFLSCEPLLGPLNLKKVLGSKKINWVIVGGESGPGARKMEPKWVTSIRKQCQLADVPFFFKQWGGTRKKLAGRVLERRTWDEYPLEAQPEKVESVG